MQGTDSAAAAAPEKPSADQVAGLDRERPLPEFFSSSSGELAELIRRKDWSQTPLGPVEGWSPALRMMIGFLLANRFPLLLWWGPEYASIYNDAYRPILGRKHPASLGRPVSEVWAEIWDVLQPLIDTPFNGGPPTWMEDLFLEINRHGFVEETHFTVAYSPVPDETAPRGVGGVLATVHEITEKVVGERRVQVLRDLGAGVAEARTAEQSCALAAATLSKYDWDVPFALLYLIDADGKLARLTGAAGIEGNQPASPLAVDLQDGAAAIEPWPLARVVETETTQIVEAIGARLSSVPRGPWPDPPHTAILVPIKSNVPHQLAGVLVAGVSPRLRLDELYRSFFELVATQIATAIANARAYEEERKRAEALAEIDRAKTLFFSNVSHEFRTPLTLMLGPLEDALAGAGLPTAQRERLDIAHRNSLRLLKLVNSLLDFSRIEAGRAQATYEPVDLGALTAELASNFRSACHRAGLALRVECPPLPEPVYVDRDMWEKIVLNLLSNAFKFTFEGEITVGLRAVNERVELSVRDTGVGVPAVELPRLFERFHRIEGQKSRTYEGSGIGLALVQELVKLHGGAIAAESEIGRGTVFTVSIPFGTAHLPRDRLGAERNPATTSVRAAAYVEEALRGLPDGLAPAEAPSEAEAFGALPPPRAGARILLADDNADMRAYVHRLLEPNCAVQPVADGQAALEAIRERRPDLVLADVMMPRLDGFGLLRAIRADPALRDIPVVMLSARAGEESRVEGLDAGADDYLIKPFSARELIARVNANLELSRVRRDAAEAVRESEARLRAIFDGTYEYIGVLSPDGTLLEANRASLEFAGSAREEVVGRPFWETVWFARMPGAPQKLRKAVALAAAGKFVRRETALARPSGEIVIFDFSLHPVRDEGGKVVLIVAESRDISERKHAEKALGHRGAQFSTLLNEAPLGVYLVDADFRIREANPVAVSAFGNIPDLVGRDFDEIIRILWPAHYADEIVSRFRHTLATGEPHLVPEDIEQRLDHGVIEYCEWRISRILLPEGCYGVVCYFRDISAQLLARRAIAASEERLAAELAATRRLQEISTRLIQEGDVDALHHQILDAAVAIMHSDIASMQMFDPARGELRLLASKGFDAAATAFWERVRLDSGSSCGLALRSGQRVIVPDIERCHSIAGSPDFDTYRRLGIRAVQSTPLRSRSGSLLGMISTHWIKLHEPSEGDLRLFDVLARQAADLIERTRAEAELRELNESLERRIAERSRELEEAMEQRRRIEAAMHQAQRLEAIGQLTGGVAHDFNNLLTVVAGHSESIAAAARDENIRRRAAAIQRAADRGARLTGQLLAFSRRQRLVPRAVGIGALMDNIDDLVRRAAGETVTVEFSADPHLWPSLVDPAQFESAILNLALNAKDAMPDGGRLTIDARNATVARAEAMRLDIRPGDYVLIAVADTGTGMPAEIRQHVFEPFFTTKDVGKGTGLGLAQIYGFVRQSGGAVTLESDVGKGTTVFLHLPRAEVEARDEPSPSEPALRSPGHGRTILIVEDQPDVRDVIEASLGDLGYRILTASDGVEARRMLEGSESIDLLLTDLVMPNGVSGVELAVGARRLRQDLKVVLVSGYSRDSRVRAGAFGDNVIFLEKPFRQAELAHSIAAAFGSGPASI